MSFLRKVVGKKCAQSDCVEKGKLVAVHMVLCPECGTKLEAVTVVNRRAAAVATLVAVVILAGSVAGVKAYVTRMVLQRQAALLDQGVGLARRALSGATKGDADRVIASVARRLDLNEEQRGQLASALQRDVSRLPNDITADLQSELATIIRRSIEDGVQPSPDDPTIAAFVREHRLAPEKVRTVTSRLTAKAAAAAPAISEGKRFAAEGKVAEAHAAFTRATTADPENAFGWANLGAAAMLLGHEEEARRDYEHALRLDRDNWLAHYNLGVHYARATRTEQALSHLEQAVRQLRREQRARAELNAVLQNLQTDQTLKELRNDPRYRQMLAAN